MTLSIIQNIRVRHYLKKDLPPGWTGSFSHVIIPKFHRDFGPFLIPEISPPQPCNPTLLLQFASWRTTIRRRAAIQYDISRTLA
jgi:hypothetical protein